MIIKKRCEINKYSLCAHINLYINIDFDIKQYLPFRALYIYFNLLLFV